jgi:hypothetical protein
VTEPLRRDQRNHVQLFLDIRAAVLNGTLEASFRRLYPQFRPANGTAEIAKAA